MKISVVIPVYKSKTSLLPLCQQIKSTINALEDFNDSEIILVEDGGEDGSWDTIKALAHEDSKIVGIQLSKNFGQHHAITAGLDICAGDWIVVMDCDLQDTPETIKLLYEKAKEGYDIVNVRRIEVSRPYFRKCASFLFNMLFEYLSDLAYDQNVGNFKIFNRKVLNNLKMLRESNRTFSVQVHWLGFKKSYIEASRIPRYEGNSSYSIARLLILAVSTAVSYSNKPLRISIFLGLSISILSGSMALWLCMRNILWKIPILGWSSLMVSIWFIGGVILANLGILGIYLGNIYNEVKRRPLYVIADRIN